MTMKTYARIQNGRVAELFSTDGDMKQMFHPDLVWVECDEDVACGDLYADGVFTKPVPAPETAPAQILNPEQKLAAFLAANPDVLDLVKGTA